MGLTIFQKGLVLVAVPLIVQTISSWLIADGVARQKETHEWANHSKHVQNQAQQLLVLMLDAESALRGYLLTGNAVSIERFKAAASEVADASERLQSLVADNSQQSLKAADIAALASEITKKRRSILKLAEQGDSTEAVKQVKVLEDREVMASLRGKIQIFQEEEDKLESVRVTEERDAQTRLQWILLGNALLALAVTLLLAILFLIGIKRRMQVLMDNVHRLAMGVPLGQPLGGTDEAARIDGAFHDLARALNEASEVAKKYTENLEKHVRERTEELAKSNRELRHNSQENEMFVYSVSHDLRAPLVNLQGFSRELAMTCKDLRKLFAEESIPIPVRQRGLGLLDKDVKESIHFISTGVTRLSSIIDALLRLSRAGRVEYRNQLVDVGSLVRRIVESLRLTIEEKKVAVAVQQLPATWGDPTALEQVFANLISNALKYLDSERSGAIQIGWQKAALQGHRIDAYFVKDNGLGIAEAYQDKIFQAFQRVHADVAPGDGMGLAIVRRVVERHHGRVWVESKPNEGSVFYVSLPGRRSGERNDEGTDGHSAG